MPETLKRTPLYDSHLKLKARMVPFAGYEMPVQYTGVLSEAVATRKSLGLFDVSHMGQFSLKGQNPLLALQKLVTNDLSKLQVGQAQYNMLLNDKAGVIDDLIVYHRSDKETYICVNASNRQRDFEWMKSKLAKSVTLTDESEDTALIALQGPKAQDLMAQISDRLLANHLKYYWANDSKIFGIPCYLSRTGYTGEDGFEIYLKADKAVEVWNKLLDEGKKFEITPCGLGARDTLRLEMGYALHGHEISEDISPLSAGLGWTVKFKPENDFIGKSILAKESKEGVKKILKGFVVQDRRIARQGYKIYSSGQCVGEITSGTQSPHLNAPIAMGFVTSNSKPPYTVEVREAQVEMKVATLPFVPSHVKKN